MRVNILFLFLVLFFSLMALPTFAEEKEDTPEWKKKFLKSIEKSMSNMEHHKFGEKFNVVSYSRKGLELKPGGFSETEDSYEEINIYKNDKLIVTITAGDDGGHGIIIFNNPKNRDRTLSINTSDMDGDGLHDNLSYTVINKKGEDVKTVYDDNFDGEIDTVIDLKKHITN